MNQIFCKIRYNIKHMPGPILKIVHKINNKKVRHILQFIVDFVFGVYYRIPICCVTQHSLEKFDYFKRKWKRWDQVYAYGRNWWFHTVENKKLKYVPCDKCIKKTFKSPALYF